MKNLLQTLLAAAISITVASCVMEEPVNVPVVGNDEVTITLNTPGNFNTPETRALTDIQENTLKDVYVLLFGTDKKLVVAAEGRNAKSELTTGTYSGKGVFSVNLPQKGDGENYTVVVIANAASVIEAKMSAIAGQSIDDVVKTLTQPFDTRFTGDALPMWGSSDQSTTITSSLPTIDLVRSFARVDVELAAATIPFELNSVYVMRPNNKYNVAPLGTNVSGNKATTPTIPDGTTSVTVENSVADFRFEPDAGENFISRSIYVPEAEIDGVTEPGERMAIVVGGFYDGSNDATFYRLDFADEDDNLLDVLRNYLYRFVITDVSGLGYTSEEEAYNSRPMNITGSATIEEDTTSKHIVFDDQYYLALDPGMFNPEGSAAEYTLNIETDNQGFTATVWDAPEGTGINSRDWLKIGPGKDASITVANPDDDAMSYDLPVWVTTNPDPLGSRTAYIVVTAGRLKYVIEVNQRGVAGVRAIPGVIGYYSDGPNVGLLTLDGDDGDDEDIVYMAYFRHGSLVALSGQDNGTPFSEKDIIWSPTGYKDVEALRDEVALLTPGNAAMAAIPSVQNVAENGDHISQYADPSNGLGDICSHYFGNFITPSRYDWDDFIGDEDADNGTANYSYVPNGKNASDPAMGVFQAGTAMEMELPAAGYRATYDSGQGKITRQGQDGYYMSSNATSDTTHPYEWSFKLNFNNSSASSISRSVRAGTVRCVAPGLVPIVESADPSMGRAWLSREESRTGGNESKIISIPYGDVRYYIHAEAYDGYEFVKWQDINTSQNPISNDSPAVAPVPNPVPNTSFLYRAIFRAKIEP